MSSLFGQNIVNNNNVQQPGINVDSQQPVWFQNQKRRTIPNHLVPKKKTGFQITTSSGRGKNNEYIGVLGPGGSGATYLTSNDSNSSALASKDQFSLVSFGNQQRKSLSLLDKNGSVTLFDNELTKYDETINETLHEEPYIHANGDDLPPTRSIYDLNDEILASLNKPVQHIDSFINKDPKNFNNVFNKADGVADKEAAVTQEKRKSINPLVNNEAAILVFGYPESISNQIIQHFKEFGDILENFEVNQKKNSLLNISHQQQSKLVPIFSGKSWVKITFDNPASVADALQENGAVFNGVLLGVIPYNKNSIEKLQKRKLTDSEDIGGRNNNFSLGTTTPEGSTGTPNSAPTAPANPSSYTTRLDIKDGSQFFLKTDGDQSKINGQQNPNEEKLGFFGKVSKYVFGFHEL